jgi:cysteine desulfurase family protein (TIGR01976 family)
MAAALDVAAVRRRFSALRGDFVFLDAPGGSQVPDEVGEAVARTLREASANVGASYETSRRAGAILESARGAAARFLGCSAEEIVFGANMTTLNFTLSRTAAREWREGDEVIVTRLDHDGNVAPWLELAQDQGLVVRLVDVSPEGRLDLDDLQAKLSDRTRVVAFACASNVIGTTAETARVAALAHDAGAIAWADAVHYAPHEPIDVAELGVDVLLCSAYKFCGPHLGLVYARRELMEEWRPYKARPAPTIPVGRRFETGTPPFELLAGLEAALAYLESIGGMPAIRAYERELGERLLAGLPERAVLYGPQTMEGRVPTFLLNVEGMQATEAVRRLTAEGFGVWAHDSYYALGLHERLGWGEAIRVGLIHYNTADEVDRFLAALAAL